MDTESQSTQSAQPAQVSEAAPVFKKPRAKRTERVTQSVATDVDIEVGRAIVDALKKVSGGATHGAAAKAEVQKADTPKKPRAPAKISDAERERRRRIGTCASAIAKKWKSLPSDDPIRVDIETRAKQIRSEFEAVHGKGKNKPKCPINKFRLMLKEATKIFPNEAFVEIRHKKAAEQAEAASS